MRDQCTVANAGGLSGIVFAGGPEPPGWEIDDYAAWVMASRLAEEPEFTSTACLTPKTLANSFSNCEAKRPVVSQKSSELSTRL